MALIYLVRKKKFKTIEGVKELYYAVQRKLQVKGGKTEEDIANIRGGNTNSVNLWCEHRNG